MYSQLEEYRSRSCMVYNLRLDEDMPQIRKPLLHYIKQRINMSLALFPLD